MVRPAGPEEILTVEAGGVRYLFTSHGGGLKLAELVEYPEYVGRGAKKLEGTNRFATLNTKAPVPAFALLGDPSLQGDGQYTLARAGTGVRAEKTLPSGVRVIKEFHPGTNYLLEVKLRLENPGNQPIRVPAQEWVIGTATPINPHDQGTYVGAEWFDGKAPAQINQAWFANKSFGCVPGTPHEVYLAGNSNVVWSSVFNQFFALITMPPTNAPAPSVLARPIPLPAPSAAEVAEDSRTVAHPVGIQSALLYPETVLAPQEAQERHYQVFAGPKEYKTLDRLGNRLGNQVDLVMGFQGVWGFFPKILLVSMNGLHALGLSYGLAIIGITLIIKLLFWPLTQASTRSMKRLQQLQPQLKAIQEKYKEDPQKMNRKTMEFMKEHKVNPAAGCLPILIQIPVFIGFYKMLQSSIELRGASFLWARDLSQPDTIAILFGFPINPLPLLMGASQVWQARLTPPSPGVDPTQQKIMQYMPLIFLFILYNFSSGLTLYWTVQNLLTIAQMKLTKAKDPTPAATAPPARRKT
jgi:YidC/Oxa1 family membrane protein insertase